ncbi:MAG: 23S rRNA (guanosine(2251)-2'-O)-methyltransferase RlmB [Bacteroidetes bacterium]|nr:23S rRNA (guanosine(2251)-2'-O)-methyltransferase RlmB [Bacteroidota bacterium]MBU1678369.1 23S rRNA (guanosine(2251)-2'-O)-methyltransferase RlmB [Bacteroidota bacterium]
MSIIIGRKPVLEALKADVDIEQIICSFGLKGESISQILNLARKKGIKIKEYSNQKFKELVQDQNSQGIAAVKSSYIYSSLQEVISKSKKSPLPLLLLLDSIQDPHNLGAIIRTAESAGVDGIVITTHNSAAITSTVEKTSAGAVSHVKIAQITNLNQTIKTLKEQGFWVVGSYLSNNTQDYTTIDYKIPIAIIMGNEEKGLHKHAAENCDFLASIPMLGKIQSLNVSVATGVLLYEIIRQRSIQ